MVVLTIDTHVFPWKCIVTRGLAEFERVQSLFRQGLNNCEISRITDIPLTTVRRWRVEGRGTGKESECPICGYGELETDAYAYLLGLYLGDGHIVKTRSTFRLSIYLDQKYEQINQECVDAMARIHPSGRVGIRQRDGCVEIYNCWNHWPCLFPQHGPGPKHLREISLETWQEEIACNYTARLLRGLIHSDGSRYINRVRNKKKQMYAYPRYEFKNNSEEIRVIFCQACDRFGVHWTKMNGKSITVSRRQDIAKLDLIVGPKC